jgi:hypothetical protein
MHLLFPPQLNREQCRQWRLKKARFLQARACAVVWARSFTGRFKPRKSGIVAKGCEGVVASYEKGATPLCMLHRSNL